MHLQLGCSRLQLLDHPLSLCTSSILSLDGCSTQVGCVLAQLGLQVTCTLPQPCHLQASLSCTAEAGADSLCCRSSNTAVQQALCAVLYRVFRWRP